MSVPVLWEMEWTGEVRRVSDFIICLFYILAAISLWTNRRARLAFATTLLLCASRLIYDWVAADLNSARGETIMNGDLVGLLAASTGLAIAFFSSRHCTSQ